MRKIALNNILSSSDLIGGSHITLKDPSVKPKDDNKGDDDRKERGNVFFYILLAVALFAALSYAVSRNNTGSTNIFDEEQAKLAAQEIIEYGNTVANAVQKLRLRGCSDTEISFYDASLAVLANYQHTPEVADSCKVFSSEGGNITYVSPNIDVLETGVTHSRYGELAFAAETLITGVGTDGAGPDSAELFFVLPWVNDKVCVEINRQLGLGDAVLTSDFHWTNYFRDGSYDDDFTVVEPSIEGRLSACISNAANIFYQVLITR